MDWLEHALPLWPILWDFVIRAIVEEQILGPRWKFLVPFIQVATVVAESAWASWAVANSPDSSAPNVAVCATPSLSLPRNVSVQLRIGCGRCVPFLQASAFPSITRPCTRCVSSNWTETSEPPLLLASLTTAHVLLLLDVAKAFVLRCT